MKKIFNHKGEAVFYRVTGEGDPVIFLHGFAEDNEIWNHQVLFLRNHFRLVVPDLPGSGQSELRGDISIEEMADVIKAILDEENISETAMIGHSMGGYVALAFAERYPQLLRGIGLFHSTAFADPVDKKVSRQKNIDFIQTHGTLPFLKQSVPTLFSNDFKTHHPDIVQELIRRHQNFNPLSLSAYHVAMMQRPDRTRVLKQFVKPVLFIIGKHDNAVPFDDSMRLCHLPALSYIHVFQNSGHMGMLEEIDKSNRVLKEFLCDA